MKIVRSFTLVETLVATFVITVALGTLVHGMSRLMGILNISKSRDIATNAVREILAEIGGEDISLIETDYDGQTFPVPELLPLGGNNEAGSITVREVNPGLFNVVARVDWQQGVRLMNVEYSTFFVVK